MADQNPLPHIFDLRASDATSWFLHASTLKQAADELWQSHLRSVAAPPNFNLPPDQLLLLQPARFWNLWGLKPYGLMAGLALETLVKGILVGLNPDDWIKSGWFDWRKKDHNLKWLADRAALPVDEKQVQMLARLTDAILWTSRYPAPRGKTTYSEVDQGIPRDEWETFDALYNAWARRLWEVRTGKSWEELMSP